MNEAREAYDRIERKFESANSIPVSRAWITKEEWELAKTYLRIQHTEETLRQRRDEVTKYFDEIPTKYFDEIPIQ